MAKVLSAKPRTETGAGRTALTPSRTYTYAMKPDDEALAACIDCFFSDIWRDGCLLAAARRHKPEAIVAR